MADSPLTLVAWPLAGQKEVPTAGGPLAQLASPDLGISIAQALCRVVGQDMASRIRAKEAELAKKQEALLSLPWNR